MNKVSKLIIGAILLDSVLAYTVIRSYKRSKQLLEKQEPFTNRTYIKLKKKKNNSERNYTCIGEIQEKKAM